MRPKISKCQGSRLRNLCIESRKVLMSKSAPGKQIPSSRCESETHWYRGMIWHFARYRSLDQKQRWSGVIVKMLTLQSKDRGQWEWILDSTRRCLPAGARPEGSQVRTLLRVLHFVAKWFSFAFNQQVKPKPKRGIDIELLSLPVEQFNYHQNH